MTKKVLFLLAYQTICVIIIFMNYWITLFVVGVIINISAELIKISTARSYSVLKKNSKVSFNF